MSRHREDIRGKALDLWQGPADAGEPMVCVATSFTFDAEFFETECLGRFLQMSSHPSESESVGYLIEREEKLAGAKVCALVDRGHARDKASLRWDVLGVLVPQGIQHAKVALLVWANHVRVIVGSGNATEPGYRQNLEVFGSIELSKAEGGHVDSVEKTIEFLSRVVDLAVGEDRTDTPKFRVRSALSSVKRWVSSWPKAEAKIRDPLLICSLPDNSILDQVGSAWPQESPPRTISVVSPFFDRPGFDQRVIADVVSIMAKKRPRVVNFALRAEALPDGQIRVYAPKGMIEAGRLSCEIHVHRVLPERSEEIRYLHAKMLRIENDQWQMLLVGSSNFTSAGLLGGNLEANILYRLKRSDEGSALLDGIWPEIDQEELDIDSPALVWDPEPEELEGGGTEVALPGAFRDAIYSPKPEPRLTLILTAELPTEWRIRIPNGEELLSSSSGIGGGHHICQWLHRPVPFVLEVSWLTTNNDTAVASWPVNVSDPSALLPPDALRDLSLEELLEILASTRPLSEATVKVIQKRTKGAKTAEELDPLKRFDSQATLLRRTKRVSVALARLRERLERPALTEDAFEWRLNGVIGPMRLADALIRETNLPGETKFYLAELALALKRLDPNRIAAGDLTVATVSEAVSEVLRDIELRAAVLPPTPETAMLDEYVAAAFAEVTTL